MPEAARIPARHASRRWQEPGCASRRSLNRRYRRPYYQLSIETSALNPNETLVRVRASITAWYEDENPSRAGYRSLISNGRLENDLFERVQEALSGASAKSARTHETAKISAAERPNAEITGPNKRSLPDTASVAKMKATLKAPPSTSVPAATYQAASEARQSGKHIQELEQQAKSLQEILEHQSKPEDLAVVKNARTQVLSRPVPGARVLMLADTEDEFQVIEAENDWVHVQLTGLQRGWVRREQLDLSGVSSRLLASHAKPTLSTTNTIQQTREETATFPGQWEPLRGKKVKIIWVDDSRQNSGLVERAKFARSVFRKTYPELSQSSDKVDGVVIVFDAADGGMAAATVADLRRLNTGELSDAAFWKQCWLDPPEAFQKSQ
jgi:hypothetical protein